MNKVVLFLSNHYITLYSFRRELIARLIAEGNVVYISIPYDERNQYFEDQGCKILITNISRRGTNPFEDIGLLFQYIKIINEVKPDIVFSYTIKPNIYGAMVTNRLGIKQVCNITGTGATFLTESVVSKIVRVLYRCSLKKCYKVFFQNSGDRDYFVKYGLVNDNYDLLPGSGVNIDQHDYARMPDDDEVGFLFIGRVMHVKGIEEYLDCAKAIKEKYPHTHFYIAGWIEEDKYKSVLDGYAEQGIIDYLGFQNNIDDWIRKCHCTILPSHGGEGVPNVLLESAAVGRACIASDICGSVEAVDDGVTGYIFQAGNSRDLIEKVERFIKLPLIEKRAMGHAAREYVEKQFNRQIVVEKYMCEVCK